MSADSIRRIGERAIAETNASPASKHNEILHRCIADMASDLAAKVYVAAHHAMLRTPRDDQLDLVTRLDAHAAVIGCDLGIEVRRSVHPDLPANAGMTEIELFAARTYWAALTRLVVQTSGPGGSA